MALMPEGTIAQAVLFASAFGAALGSDLSSETLTLPSP